MTTGIKTVVYPVRDLDRAKALYGQLAGVAPYVDEPHYAGFWLGALGAASTRTATRKAAKARSATGTWRTSSAIARPMARARSASPISCASAREHCNSALDG